MTPYSLHRSGAIRKVVRSRLKEALRLVIIRGARGPDACKANSMILEESDAIPEKWVMKDWTYVFKPTMTLYKTPMPTIIDEIRNGLRSVKSMAEQLETCWQRRTPSTRDPTRTVVLNRKPSRKPFQR
ncbi:hypothetical protein FRC00_002828 [Tulasnella sp. 408]|nr:hypothetical protein FRC00_002828 [Tulasnella sp. 408]